MTSTLSLTQENALKKVLALRKLSHETENKTWRAQNAVLQRLDPAELADVAIALDEHKQQFGW
jgi:hypothetical protein